MNVQNEDQIQEQKKYENSIFKFKSLEALISKQQESIVKKRKKKELRST